jgi:hypothetical protein
MLESSKIAFQLPPVAQILIRDNDFHLSYGFYARANK